MRIPKSFNQITISQFQECYFLLNEPADPNDPFCEVNRWIKVISAISGIPHDDLESLPGYKRNKLIRQLSFLLDDEGLNKKVKKYIALNGRIYKSVYKASELSMPQAIDLKTFMKARDGMSEKETIVENAHRLLACIYVPLTLNGFKYDGAKHEKIANDFLNAKMGDVYGTLFFYSGLWESWIKLTETYGTEAVMTIQDHMKEVEEWMKRENLEITGDGKLQSTI